MKFLENIQSIKKPDSTLRPAGTTRSRSNFSDGNQVINQIIEMQLLQH